MGRYNSLIRNIDKAFIVGTGNAVGPKEVSGPLGTKFDISVTDDRFGAKAYEQAESEMIKMAFNCCLKKSQKNIGDVDLMICGDLQNQCVAHSFAMTEGGIPYFGLYGACSSIAQGLALSAILVNSNNFSNVVCSASSHFSTSERQFRFPLEYGLQRTPTSQNTVTAAACFFISSKEASPVMIRSSLFGIIKDMGIKDAANMGAAMCHAALDTLQRFFVQSNTKESDYDLILTGDLGAEGGKIARECAGLYGLVLGENYVDCGELIYDNKKQGTISGGSGCGCSAAVLSAHILPMLFSSQINKILFVGTGALMSSGSVLQKLPIPGIAHLVEIIRR